jgi:hypothetical protein
MTLSIYSTAVRNSLLKWIEALDIRHLVRFIVRSNGQIYVGVLYLELRRLLLTI